MPKAKHSQHGQNKTETLYARLTPEGKQGLEELAISLNISVAELLEQMGRKQIPVSRLSLGESLPS